MEQELQDAINLLPRVTVVMVTEANDRKMTNLSNFKAIQKAFTAQLSYEI